MLNEAIILNANIDSIIARKKDQYVARRNKIENAYSEANSNIAPNVDINGRLHAPVDGYAIPQIRIDNCDFGEAEEKIFGKGEFLPNPINDTEEIFFFTHNNYAANFKHHISFKLEGADIIAVMEEIETTEKPFNIRFSRKWSHKGEEQCYMNVWSAFKSINNKLKEYIDMHNTEKMLIEKAKKEEAKKLKGKAPSGKVSVWGSISGLPVKEGYYGYEYKMMVTLENGATVYGTLPNSISDAKIGDTVSFSANFEVAEDDNTHAFFKRPTKAKVLEIQE